MKIAVIAPVEETIPPKKYGGTEWIVYHLSHGMGRKGHKVDLFASGDSGREANYNLIPTVEESLRIKPQFSASLDMRAVAKLLGFARAVGHIRLNEYDIVHNHASWRFLLYSGFVETPILTTHHGPLNFDYQNMVFLQHKKRPYISISNNQRKDLPELNFVSTIYNGVDVNDFEYFESSDHKTHNYMVFLARMSEEKGAIEAALVARELKRKLFIAVKIDKVDEPYMKKFVKYVDNNYVILRGEIDHKEKLNLLQQARCLIAPIKWEEPFGLMFIEAMACGTPVVVWARGAAPEVIKDGETGFIVNSSESDIRGNWTVKQTGSKGLDEAVERIYSMTQDEYLGMRRACRLHVERNFTATKMVDAYEKVYAKIISNK